MSLSFVIDRPLPVDEVYLIFFLALFLSGATVAAASQLVQALDVLWTHDVSHGCRQKGGGGGVGRKTS